MNVAAWTFDPATLLLAGLQSIWQPGSLEALRA